MPAGVRGNARYGAAAEALRRWQSDGVLLRDEAPAYYIYEQRFNVQGAISTRRCLFASLCLHPPEDGLVRPHEATMPGPVETASSCCARRAPTSAPSSRCRRRRRDGASDLEDSARGSPLCEATDDRGDRHRLWKVDDAQRIEALTAAVDASAVTIADGHHRYVTARAYHGEQRSESAGGCSRASSHSATRAC